MDVAIIGCGRQGNRRARAIKECGDKIIIAVDIVPEAAKAIAKEYGCEISDDWKSVIWDKRVEAVLVCTPNDTHASIAIAALKAGKHVLCEKPLARNPKEAQTILDAAKKSRAMLKCGFNHRHHPAVMAAKKHIESGGVGKLLFMRCRYGMTGRNDYEKEWRADLSICGGGPMMDQGQHVVDLFRWFGGEFTEVTGATGTLYYKIKPIEDNAFAILHSKAGHMCMMHVDSIEWKNLFYLEVFGDKGYLKIDGLGGSYGSEKLIFGDKDFYSPFSETVTEFNKDDISWRGEWNEFKSAISEKRTPLGSGEDGLAAVKVAYAVYESSEQGKAIKL